MLICFPAWMAMRSPISVRGGGHDLVSMVFRPSAIRLAQG